MLYLKLAWRNIWRNKRRTLITMSSVVMAVLLSGVMSSMQQGQYDQMIDNSVGSFMGHIQIQAPGYHDEPILDHSLALDSTLLKELSVNDEIEAIIPRIESFALAGGRKKTKAGMVIGTDVDAEKYLSKPDQKLIEGDYFNNNNEHAVLVGQGLADYLNLSVGDSLVLISSGYHGVSAADLIPIKGIVKFGIQDLNNSITYLPIGTAQNFYGAYGRVTDIAILAKNPKNIDRIVKEISADLDEQYKVYGWQQLMPELVQAIQADRGSGYIILLVLYMIVGFGILGTVLMMTAERKYEFGVMLAIGTSRLRMALMLILEMTTITVLGTIAGIVACLPFIFYFNINPLHFTGEAAAAIEEYGMEPFIRFSTDPELLLIQAGIILIISLVISIYPIIHSKKLNPVEAMRH